jgi:hypothetical protein
MATQNLQSVQAQSLPATIASHSTTIPASKRWRTGAFLLAGAAQLITISALIWIMRSDNPIPATWAALLLATAPAPLAAAAAFTRAPVARIAALVAAVVLIAGIAGTVLDTGLFFAPALVLLVVGAAKLWREQDARTG